MGALTVVPRMRVEYWDRVIKRWGIASGEMPFGSLEEAERHAKLVSSRGATPLRIITEEGRVLCTYVRGDRSACPYIVEEGDEVMSNFDHIINIDAAKALCERESFARYSGWNFNGRVWFDRDADTFACEVWVHHVPRKAIVRGTLREIMDEVSAEYGSE